jgi:metal-dependent amidase/aminoacylase/carboxypeptidase family protein
VNALDAFVQAYNNVSTLRQHFLPDDRVHGVLDDGGVAPNVIPAYTKSRWIVRAGSFERFDGLKRRIIGCFEAAATSTGCRLEIATEGEPYTDLVSSAAMVELFVRNSGELGRQMPTFDELGIQTFASSDMGNVSHIVPSIHPSIAIETNAVNHQAEFADATITPSGERAIRDGALAMAHTIIDMAGHNVWDRL